MGVPGSVNNLLGAGGAPQYKIERSLRFNSADSAYLSRNFSSGNQKTWTWSAWVKVSALSSTSVLFGVTTGTSDSTWNTIRFVNGNLRFNVWTTEYRISSAVFRDFSAWYHIVVALNTPAAAADDRVKIYVNGTQITTFDTNNAISQNADLPINSAVAHTIGASTSTSQYFSGCLADIYFLDGTATTPSTFAETDAITGQWVPKTPASISYGTNGFRLTFSDNSGTTSTTLGKDAAGSNNWTPNNFSVASGSGNDSLVDSPTSYGTDTGAGGEVRGNYATLNPLNNAGASGTYSNGNLEITTGSSQYGAYVSTIATPTSGKWYAEAYITSGANTRFGFVKASYTPSSTEQLGNVAGTMAYRCDNGDFRVALTTKFTGGATCTSGDTVGLALDNDNGEVKIYKNGSLQGTATGIEAANWCFAGSDDNGAGTATHIWNFGQRAFAYTAPSGFKALNTQNLPEPSIKKPSSYFDAKLYTGTGGSLTVSGLNFSPDLVWLKMRSDVADHQLYDVVRGTTKKLQSNTTAAEVTTSGVTAFNSDGFTLGSDGGSNGNNYTHVAWCWDESATPGFDIVTYTGNGTNRTIAHSLGVAPSMIIVKDRTSGTANWIVGHTSIGWGNRLYLNDTSASTAAATTWNSTAPTSSVFSVGTSTQTNANGDNHVAYLWSEVASFSKFGSYVGNGSSDGPFVFTGFRVRWLMIKNTTKSTQSWLIRDSVRDTYNSTTSAKLAANLSDAENGANVGTASQTIADFLSNGFKVRTAGGPDNDSGDVYVWAAFAESPFQYARAR